ncbi:MAG: RRXRR domain-containing protein [Pseudomonadota bacterium]
MQRVCVLAHNKQPLMPCHPARARKLLKKGKAAVLRCYPFTIIMKHRVGGDLQPIEIKRLKKIQAQAKAPLKDAAAVNATRYATGNALKGFGLPITFSSGGRTKFNRIKLGYSKDHWIDAACVGESGAQIVIPQAITPLIITAKGRGSRQKCRMNQYGFPRTSPKKQ